jgi:hypothetical protein
MFGVLQRPPILRHTHSDASDIGWMGRVRTGAAAVVGAVTAPRAPDVTNAAPLEKNRTVVQRCGSAVDPILKAWQLVVLAATFILVSVFCIQISSHVAAW